MRHPSRTLIAAGALAALLTAPAAAKTLGEQIQADAADLGVQFERDVSRVGAAMRDLVTGKRRGAVGEPVADPTPADPDAVPNGAPFAADRSTEVRTAAGIATSRISPTATLARVEGVRRPAGLDGPMDLRLRLTNHELWDASLSRDGRGDWLLTRLQKIDQPAPPKLEKTSLQ